MRVANTNGRGSDQYDFILERSGRDGTGEYVLERVGRKRRLAITSRIESRMHLHQRVGVDLQARKFHALA